MDLLAPCFIVIILVLYSSDEARGRGGGTIGLMLYSKMPDIIGAD